MYIAAITQKIEQPLSWMTANRSFILCSPAISARNKLCEKQQLWSL